MSKSGRSRMKRGDRILVDEWLNVVAGPTPVGIVRSRSNFYCIDRDEKMLAGPFVSERSATAAAHTLAEQGRPRSARLRPGDLGYERVSVRARRRSRNRR